jgi:nitrite reductase/ring-hydroxylating ferredoxin subunit
VRLSNLSNLSNFSESSFVKVASEDDVREGSMFGVAVAGKPIMLSKIGGKIYAMDAVCSHSKGELRTEYLPDGQLGGHPVVCPVHKAQFEVTTGKVVKNVPGLLRLATHKEATDLRTYEVKVVDKSVQIRV